MEAIKFILKYLIKLVIILIVMSALIWGVTIFFPSFSLRDVFLLSSDPSSNEGWLPAPGSFSGLLKTPKTQTADDGVFNYTNTPGYSGVDYITYTSSGMRVTHAGGQRVSTTTPFGNPTSGGYAEKTRYIRNLSIYEGGRIYTGISFYGEAKNTMFQNGKFPIIIADNVGRVVSVSDAEAMSSWSVPGWIRFRVQINSVLPNRIPCTMIFQSASSYTGEQPTRVAIPIVCN